MANSLLTINMVTREAVRLFKNTNMFIKNMSVQYDDQFARDGAKIGTTLRVRLPNDYTVRTGPGLSVQDTAEQSITLTVATQKGVDVAFTTEQRTMDLDDYSERVLSPMVNNLAGEVAADVMTLVEGGVCNYVSNVDGSGNVIAPTATTFLNAGASLNDNSAPMNPGRKIVLNQWTEAATVSALSGLFNPSSEISAQYRTGQIKNALGFDWFMDQTVVTHTNGTFTAGTVSGADQTGTTLTTNAITGTLAKGDIITIENVNAVNRVTKRSTGKLRQFVITVAAASGATSLSIYPAIVAPIGGAAVQYQTVTASPENAAAISLVGKPSEATRRNTAFCKDTFTMVTADLVMPKKVEEAAREVYDGVSMRMITDYVIGTDQLVTRLDVLYGYLSVRPEWGVLIADSVS